jgi:hypothetical protein
VGRLVSLLALRMAGSGGWRAMSALWIRVVKELRQHWESAVLVPRMRPLPAVDG